MFIDPEPRRHTHSSMARSPSQTSMSSVYHSPGRPDTAKRKPLGERTQSENNRRQPGQSRNLQKPTVRLIRTQSPSRSPLSSSDGSSPSPHDIASRFHDSQRPFQSSSDRLGSASSLDYGIIDAEPSFQDSLASASTDRDVSAQWRSVHETSKFDPGPTIFLRSSDPKEDAHHSFSETKRSSGSRPSQFLSSSTLLDVNHSESQHDWTSSRFSQGTTLRGTPTPTEQDLRDLIDREKDLAKSGAPQILETLPEASPERTSPSAKASSETESNWRAIGKDSSPSQSSGSIGSDPHAAPSPDVPRWNRSASCSEGSLPEVPAISRPQPTLSPSRGESSRDTYSLRPSSPIVVVYESDSSQPHPRTHAIHYTPSVESIQSRLQYPTIIQPQTTHFAPPRDSLASLRPSSPEEADYLPPLYIPRRRSRKQPVALADLSTNATRSASNMQSDEPDVAPNPRQQFQTALSTILSEGDSASQAQSHFSIGSGVLTEDESIRQSISRQRPRRPSTLASLADDERSLHAPGTAQSDDDMDRTFASFRQISAKPAPLFKAHAGMPPDRRYDGPRPPIPPIPVTSPNDENFDTVSELQTPSLKAKRSGYSLRQRSHSSPSQHTRQSSQASFSETNRRSNGSSIFPAWAKFFYSGTIHLASPSKTSLHHAASYKSLRRATSHKSLRQLYRMGHKRGESTHTVGSITSHLGCGDSFEDESSSPTSSHFLPSIFRHKTGTPRDKLKKPVIQPDLISAETVHEVGVAERTSVSVIPNTAKVVTNGPKDEPAEELLPSGHPKWGKLKDESSSSRPVPHCLSDETTALPSCSSRERMSDYINPRLLPSQRASQSRLSLWRPPSFVESLDSIFRSKVNRQIILFAIGFVCPLLWMLAACLSIPPRPVSASELEKNLRSGNDDRAMAAMMQHQAGNAEQRWREERVYLKAQWWRWVNRIMSVIGVFVIIAVIALGVIAAH